ncbi:Lipid-A-disaccharide synthase [hydrothermal vent metagenome]|uniref:lipid-A-disaccharide synthase n=1 Tax=hydrothermal vent metagenome TaxID=652676 RepID=A0A3B1CGP8_9ZZZZ
MNSNSQILVIAGEASGDLHGAALAEELLQKDSSIQLVGIGGDKMLAAGVKTIFHIRDMAFLGMIEVIKHLPFIFKVEKEIIQLVKKEKIKLAVLIDYPGFNLRIAKKLKALGLKIVYYISPQIWAWKKGRIKKIRKRVDKMLVVFPFEKDIYEKGNVPVEYVGHPLVERIEKYNFLSKEDLFRKLELKEGKEILLVLPGSRKHEIEKLLPELTKTAEKLSVKFNMQTVIACADNLEESYLQGFVNDKSIKIVKGITYDLLKHSKFGIIKSGTSTLEAAIFSIPFVVVYLTNKLTYALAKKVIQLDFIAMPNIIAGKEIIKEFIQDDVNAELIFNYCEALINDNVRMNEVVENLRSVKNKLGGSGASKNSAEIILNELHEV